MTDLLPESLTKGINVVKAVVKTLTLQPGVYRMVASDGEVLYVGKAKNLKNRVSSYTLVGNLTNRHKRMISETCSMEIVTTATETEALLLESNLIKKIQPRYNVLLKDDKSFPYILFTADHSFPRLIKHRGAQRLKGEYFGPFASVSAVDEALVTLHRVFRLRSCSDSFFSGRKRPCLQYHIKRCSAPCVDKISEEDYKHSVKQAKSFLLGKATEVQDYLSQKMFEASEGLQYEEAAAWRDRLRLLTKMQAYQRINVHGLRNADIVALAEVDDHTCIQMFFYRHGRNYGTESFFLSHAKGLSPEENMEAFLTQFYGDHEPPELVLLSHMPRDLRLIKEAFAEKYDRSTEWKLPKLGQKKELLDHALVNARGILERKLTEESSMIQIFNELVNVFDLPTRPERIEIYDNSHIQGAHPYGVMVVAGAQGFIRQAYRKFMIKEQGPAFGGDDYAMMREVMERRFARAGESDWVLPDLMLIDGGKGQLGAVLEVVKKMDVDGITVVGIAKGPDRNAGRETFYQEGKEPYTLAKNSKTLHFLQRLRDEAHRFAIGSHRAKREKLLKKSLLDDIPGIGPKRKKMLLKHFGSAKSVSQAGYQDLLNIPGIDKTVAKVIYDYFHKT